MYFPDAMADTYELVPRLLVFWNIHEASPLCLCTSRPASYVELPVQFCVIEWESQLSILSVAFVPFAFVS